MQKHFDFAWLLWVFAETKSSSAICAVCEYLRWYANVGNVLAGSPFSANHSHNQCEKQHTSVHHPSEVFRCVIEIKLNAED